MESDPNYFRWLGVQRLWLHAAWVELPQDGPPLRIDAPPGPEWNALLQHAR